jgi:hypothetical protein
MNALRSNLYFTVTTKHPVVFRFINLIFGIKQIYPLQRVPFFC